MLLKILLALLLTDSDSHSIYFHAMQISFAFSKQILMQFFNHTANISVCVVFIILAVHRISLALLSTDSHAVVFDHAVHISQHITIYTYFPVPPLIDHVSE